ncbi:hypothetical protein ACP70R_024453 [Stipagrostis hirtigluma subsp. patula]
MTPKPKFGSATFMLPTSCKLDLDLRLLLLAPEDELIRFFVLEMMKRRFLNLVTENLDTGLYSLRRLDLSSHLFYPSVAAAEAATARTEAAIMANAEAQAGYKHGLRHLRTMATSLAPLPDATINLRPCGPNRFRPSLDLVALLGDESRILCADTTGRTALYDASSHAVMCVPDLWTPKGPKAIPISITLGSDGHPGQRDRLCVLGRRPLPDPGDRERCFEQLSYGGDDVFSEDHLIQYWSPLPPPPFLENEPSAVVGPYTVVGTTIYASPEEPGTGTYSFDTVSLQWRLVSNWRLPFYGKAEYLPELNLCFGLSSSRPFHLCAADLSALNFERPPATRHTWVDFDMPKSWMPFHLDLINLGSGRFCIVKMFESTEPSQYDEAYDDTGEAFNLPDLIRHDFAVLTGVEVVPCDGKLRMIKHMCKYHLFEDDTILWVL